MCCRSCRSNKRLVGIRPTGYVTRQGGSGNNNVVRVGDGGTDEKAGGGGGGVAVVKIFVARSDRNGHDPE